MTWKRNIVYEISLHEYISLKTGFYLSFTSIFIQVFLLFGILSSLTNIERPILINLFFERLITLF